MGNNCFISSGERELQRKNDEIDRQIEADRKVLKKEYKILLLGEGESGKSTIVKQMKNIYMTGWTSDELLKYKPNIIANIVQSAQSLVNAMRDLDIRYQDEGLLALVDKVTENPYETFEESMYTPVFADILIRLWKDEGVQQCVERSREFYLLDSAPYYFEHAKRLAGPNYIPTVQDVLCARVKTTGITETRFSMGQLNIHMFDVGGQRSERKKWIHCFENVGSIIFCVALSGYDMVLLEDSRQNRLVESLLLFESIVNSKWFTQTSIVLLLNKTDIFQKKILKVPLSKYFQEYTGGPDFKRAAEFILRRFAELNRAKLAIYPHLTCATDESNIRVVFAAVKETILQNSLKQAGLL